MPKIEEVIGGGLGCLMLLLWAIIAIGSAALPFVIIWAIIHIVLKY